MPAPGTGDVRVAVSAGNQLGEGVLWCDREQALYWTDIHAARLWRYSPDDGATRSWDMPERLASFALCEADGWLLLALASRLAFFHPERNELRDLAITVPVGAASAASSSDRPKQLPASFDNRQDTRANDGACDRQGRFVFGTLHEPASGPKQAVGGFHRLNADLTLQALPLPKVAIANSVAFSPDGTTMYFCDSLQKKILRCDYGDDVGAAAVFVDLTSQDGEPDGSAVDAEGGLWNAQWGAARVVRYLPDGHEDRRIAVPTVQPTRPAFGGPDLRTLFVTSAHDGLNAGARREDRHAGDVFACTPGVAGVSEPRFAGDPDAVLIR